MKKSLLSNLAIFIFIAVSCSSSSSLTSAWSAPGIEAKDFQKLTVMAIFPDMQVRVMAEDALVNELAAKGIQAQPSYRVFPLAGQVKQLMGMARDSNVVKMIKNGIKQKILDQEIDGLIFLNAYNIEKTKEYHQGSSISIAAPAYGYYPGYYGNAYPSTYRGSYYDYYAYAVGTVYGKGYYSTSTSYYLQTNLFDTSTDELLWTGQTKTVDYKDLERESELLSKILITDLVSRSILKQTPVTP